MELYEQLINVNHALAQHRDFSDTEKRDIASVFLAGVSDTDAVKRFHRGVKASVDGRDWYPLFYIPPYNDGQKLRLFTGELPKTHILAANHYELEILRLLALWAPDDPDAIRMLRDTTDRLKTTCFANCCTAGECVGAGVVSLRFLSALCPRDDAWITRLITGLLNLYGLAPKRFPIYYLYAALADIDHEAAQAFIERNEEKMLQTLRRVNLSGPNLPERATYAAVRQCVLRNALSKSPRFAYVRDMHIKRA